MRRILMFRRLSNTPRHRKTGRFNIRLIHVSGNRATQVVCDGKSPYTSPFGYPVYAATLDDLFRGG